MRVRRSSCLAGPAAELLFDSATFLLLGLLLGKVVVQAVETLLPSHTIFLNPIGDLFERSCLDAAGTPLRRATAGDKPRGFKHFEVPRDGGHTHFKRLGKLRDGRLAGHQVRKDGAASGISKGGESGSELIC